MACGDFESEIGNGLKMGIVGLIIGGLWFILSSDKPSREPRQVRRAPAEPRVTAGRARTLAAPRGKTEGHLTMLERLTGEQS